MINPVTYHPGQTPLEQLCGLHRLSIQHPEPGMEAIGHYAIFQSYLNPLKLPVLIAYYAYDETEQEWNVRSHLWDELEIYKGTPDDWQRIALHCIRRQYPEEKAA